MGVCRVLGSGVSELTDRPQEALNVDITLCFSTDGRVPLTIEAPYTLNPKSLNPKNQKFPEVSIRVEGLVFGVQFLLALALELCGFGLRVWALGSKPSTRV